MSMNGLQVWPAPHLAQLAIGVPQTERGLARVHAGAEELELEDGLEVSHAGRQGRAHARTGSGAR